MNGSREHCRLCNKKAKLQKSHIVPEFAYRDLYDDRHRGYAVDALDPSRQRRIQKGLRDRLLCRDCEQLLNDRYEKPFKEFWCDERPVNSLRTDEVGLIDVPDYAAFKLFHLSVLLRADFASTPEFSEVTVGSKHRNRLADMVLQADPGKSSEYPVVCFAIDRPSDGQVWWDLVGSPNPGRFSSLRFYEFAFCGCSWLYFVGSHECKEVRESCLRESGELPVMKAPWSAIRRFAPHAQLS